MGKVKELYTRFTNDDGFTRAAALAFVGILSLAPLLLVALAVLGYLIRDPQQAARYVADFVARLMPGQQAAASANDIIRQTHITESAQGLIHARFWSALVGVLSLIWTATSLFVNASGPMNAAWEVKETRSFIKLRLVCLGVFVGAGLLFALSLLPSSGPNVIRSLHIPWLSLPQQAPLWIAALFALLAIALDIGMFVLIYRFLPNAPVTWRAALFGGGVAGILWEIFKKGFAIYLAHFGDYNKLYGTFGSLFGLMVWIYYSCVVLLAGAILCKMYHERKEAGNLNENGHVFQATSPLFQTSAELAGTLPLREHSKRGVSMTHATRNRDDISLGELFADLTEETTTLVRQEVSLARSELTQKLVGMGKEVGFLAAGGAIAYAGVLAIVAAIVLGIAAAGLPLWASALIVGVVVAGIGGALVMNGLAALKKIDPVPRQTVETLKEDIEWARHQK